MNYVCQLSLSSGFNWLVSKNQGVSGPKSAERSKKSGQKPGIFVNLWPLLT
jgi:hypothetical protein